MAARSPSLLPEMIHGNLRGLDKVFAECTWTSVRAFLAQRLCDRDGGFVAARSRCFCFFNCQVRTVLILFLSKQKTLGRAHFAFPTSNGHRGVLLAPQQHIHCAKRGPKQTLYSLRQLRLGFELQPPPLSDTTLAERLPLRVPVIHDYAQRSTTESSTHTDVVMVVVLRSRDAVCLRLASLA